MPTSVAMASQKTQWGARPSSTMPRCAWRLRRPGSSFLPCRSVLLWLPMKHRRKSKEVRCNCGFKWEVWCLLAQKAAGGVGWGGANKSGFCVQGSAFAEVRDDWHRGATHRHPLQGHLARLWDHLGGTRVVIVFGLP